MQRAWIRSVGFYGTAALIATACSSSGGGDGPSHNNVPGSRLMNLGGFSQFVDAGQMFLDASIADGGGGSGPVSSGGSGGSGAGWPMSSSVAGTGGSGGSGSVSSASSSSGMTKGDDGSPCGMGLDCMSGSCVDGVCCNTACLGDCSACTNAKKGSGSDGVCGFIKAATDPDGECPLHAGPCGAPGACNGNGACQPDLATGTPCGVGMCGGGMVTAMPTCDVNHTCTSPPPQVCMQCSGTVCMKGCTTNLDCPLDQYCAGPSCAAKLLTGMACSTAAQCALGFCVDGVCCDAACSSGPCEACTVAKGAPSDGACTLLNGDPALGSSCDDQNVCTDDACSGGKCAQVLKSCPSSNPCETSACDVDTKGCAFKSKLDGTPCMVGSISGICLARSCFTIVGVSGAGGSGGVVTTSSTATSASATTGAGGAGGAGGVGGAGGDGLFHFAGGACSVGGSGDGRLAWVLLGLLVAARRRPKRAAVTSTRGARDA